MMLSLGLFVFEIKTTAYQSLSRQLSWRWQQHDRIGLRAQQQYLGKGDENITLSGTLMPEHTGGESSLALLQQMADKGKAHTLLDGTGKVLGIFIITAIHQTRSEFFRDGTSRKIEFSLTLKRIDDHAVDRLGDLSSYVKNLIAS